MSFRPLVVAVFSFVSLSASTAAFADTISLTSSSTANYGTIVAGSEISGVASPTPVAGIEPDPYHASYTEAVYTGGSGSLCTGCLAFVFNFTNIGDADSDAIRLFTDGTSFDNYTVSAEYVAGIGIAPTGAQDNSGTINFGYTNFVGSGDSSDTLVIFTNATSYTAGVSTFDDGLSVNTAGLMPTSVAATPEPSSMILLGTGILGIAGGARRKFFKR